MVYVYLEASTYIVIPKGKTAVVCRLMQLRTFGCRYHTRSVTMEKSHPSQVTMTAGMDRTELSKYYNCFNLS